MEQVIDLRLSLSNPKSMVRAATKEKPIIPKSKEKMALTISSVKIEQDSMLVRFAFLHLFV